MKNRLIKYLNRPNNPALNIIDTLNQFLTFKAAIRLNRDGIVSDHRSRELDAFDARRVRWRIL